ncbi:exopolysaccharide biosynthesis protein [Rhizobium sp. R72]|uniref:polysaccharide biosynthesis/export family protein n=1 Tax=unclassified Rhizobium TaxID=2613769 RepID=UPI000B534645|nr:MULTISPECIES: polysaccharide biosynthesis/export family protein [unclassified Rhizobium]OWV96118.1 exopolysaccharide biosynthesis protein [Rhizobium sp. R72]OWV96602.1 exopolysaccharide biosynthesis protein [Rhizobium sp. R711]
MSFRSARHTGAIAPLFSPRSRVFRLLVAAAAAAVISTGNLAKAQDYLLGPQDVLKIRVFEWRPSTGAPFEWVPLTGEFAISSAGNLSLPIIGTVPAAGKTLEQVSEQIGERLQNQVGLQKRPNASVEISSYRPFFVTGMVATPGKYSFSPGLTVVQALSMAGGIGPADANLISLQRDALSGRGDLRALEAERLELVARQARIDAILDNSTEIKFPAELTEKKDIPGIARMLSQEEALFETRMRAMETEIEALDQARVLAANQISALKEKAASLGKQIELANKDLGSVNKLVSQGLTVSTRQLGANQNIADLESRNLDVSLAVLKTQQDLARVDQDIGDVRNRYRISALSEAAELRDRFASNAKKAETAGDLLRNLEVRAPAAIAALEEDKDTYAFTTTISRVIDGNNQSLIVSDNEPVMPGDVIRVERRQEGRSTAVANNN